MAVTCAEAVTAAYIAWARGDTVHVTRRSSDDAAIEPGTSSANSFAALTDPLAARSLLLPRLRSTRPLERFRNEVALARALHWAFGNVRQAFEDRQPLWGLGTGGSLLRREVPVSRRAELDAMVGLQRTVWCVGCSRAEHALHTTNSIHPSIHPSMHPWCAQPAAGGC